MSTIAVNAITDASGGSTAAINGVTPTVYNTIGRNRIINGDMRIDQRNAGASHTLTAGAVTYGVDRWYTYTAGASLTGQRVASTSGPNPYAYRISGATSNTACIFGTRLEGDNCADMTNRTCVVTAKIASNPAATVTWAVFYANTKDTYSAKTQITSGTINATLSPTTYTFTFNAGANAANGISIEFSVSSLTSGQSITFETIQLEIGSVATAFDYRSYGTELALCQRYYEKSFDIGTAPSNGTTTPSTLTGLCAGYSTNGYTSDFFFFKVSKRTVPVMTFYGDSSGYWWANNSSNVNTTAGSTPSQAGFGCSQQAVAGGAFVYGHWAASAEL